MAAVAARELADCEVLFVGIGLPQLACNLAHRRQAPSRAGPVGGRGGEGDHRTGDPRGGRGERRDDAGGAVSRRRARGRAGRRGMAAAPSPPAPRRGAAERDGAAAAARGARPREAVSEGMKRAVAVALSFSSAAPAPAQRAPVLQQVGLPHAYYWREMYVPQVTSGPSAVTWSPDGAELIY